ncbi:acetyltransferase [Clostridium polyendosporum]|uniref:Acetyltransferase n=1 Tax=Clostridium polyendosporum TaxID=69208 RepID=A0A919VLT5_9CLOT|nr:GNAT family N-acetyltransferase [Clostridium polyendosporum]GIM28908.1 acetyltransferase [Clostridium polyendosporum]
MQWILKHYNELTVDEFYEIAKSRFEVFTEEQKVYEQDFDDRDKDCYHLFLWDKERVVAYCRIIKKGVAYEEVSIGRVLVVNDYRRRGLAEDMIKRAIEFVGKEMKEKAITLSAQQYIVPLYRSVGFEKVSEVYMEAGIPHVKMKKKW